MGGGWGTGQPARVRHEVADVVVLRRKEPADSTCCSASSILPGHASLVTGGCEAPGTTWPHPFGWQPRREPKLRLPASQGGREPGLDGWVNLSEAVLNAVSWNKRKMLLRLSQNGLWSGPGVFGSPGADDVPPAESCDPPHPCYIGVTW